MKKYIEVWVYSAALILSILSGYVTAYEIGLNRGMQTADTWQSLYNAEVERNEYLKAYVGPGSRMCICETVHTAYPDGGER